jgi:hypothetical protein
MARYGFADRWSYRFPWESQWFGLPDKKRSQVIKSADILINVSGALASPRQYREIPRLAYIDSDPVFTQVKLARGQKDFQEMVDTHDVHFTFGENPTDSIPKTGHTWRPTRQPIVLDEWYPSPQPGNKYTTIMNWTSYKPITYEGHTYGQKDLEFARFITLPHLVPQVYLELAVNAGKTRRTPYAKLTRNGWHVVNPDRVCPDLEGYRCYIQTSRAEWSVAKNAYVSGQPGWFSCRSACYLAAGKPVIVQDTGFSNVLPTGEGILPFTTIEEAVAAIQEVESNYTLHAKAAREIAQEHFDSDKILTRLIDAISSQTR